MAIKAHENNQKKLRNFDLISSLYADIEVDDMNSLVASMGLLIHEFGKHTLV